MSEVAIILSDLYLAGTGAAGWMTVTRPCPRTSAGAGPRRPLRRQMLLTGRPTAAIGAVRWCDPSSSLDANET